MQPMTEQPLLPFEPPLVAIPVQLPLDLNEPELGTRPQPRVCIGNCNVCPYCDRND